MGPWEEGSLAFSRLCSGTERWNHVVVKGCRCSRCGGAAVPGASLGLSKGATNYADRQGSNNNPPPPKKVNHPEGNLFLTFKDSEPCHPAANESALCVSRYTHARTHTLCVSRQWRYWRQNVSCSPEHRRTPARRRRWIKCLQTRGGSQHLTSLLPGSHLTTVTPAAHCHKHDLVARQHELLRGKIKVLRQQN